MAKSSSQTQDKMKKTQSDPKLRIKLKSYDLKMLESAVTKILGLLSKSGATIK